MSKRKKSGTGWNLRSNSPTEIEKVRSILSSVQKNRAMEYVIDIINTLPSKAMKELLGGYSNDYDNLVRAMYDQTLQVVQFDKTLETENLDYLASLERAMDERLKKLSYNYFKTTVLGAMFRQGWRNLEWGNLIQLFPRSAYLAARAHGKSFEFCVAFPLWRLYSYDRPVGIGKKDIDNINRKETALYTATETQGTEHIDKIVEEIKFNDILSEKLNPTGKAGLGLYKGKITMETGAKLHLRGRDSKAIRGLHVGSVVVDDFLDESSAYSKDQREKAYTLLTTAITGTLEPYGYFLVSGTPFHEDDIYGKLKKDKTFKFFEYPAIFPDGKLLAPERFNFKTLMQIKESQGTTRFTQEYLVSPISDDSTIFPWDYLRRAYADMFHIGFVDNVESFPRNLVRVVIGADFAKSAKVGADYTVYTVWGVDNYSENQIFYLMHIWRKKGASYDEQVNMLVSLNQRFKANKIVVESNGFQSIIADLLRAKGVKNVEEFTTTAQIKKNWTDGLPALAALFERGCIRVPHREDDGSRDKSEALLSEFNSIAFRSDKNTLESTSEHDDQAMSSFFAIYDLRTNKNQFKAYSV